MAFTAPKTQAFRRFLVLDSDAVLGALSALDGGAVDEILTRKVGESGGEVGGELNVSAAKVRGKRGKSSRVEEELRRVRTEHSAASALIDKLHEREAVGVLDGTLDADSLGQLTPGMVVQMQGEVGLHPLFQLYAVMNSFIANAPKLGFAEQARELKTALPIFHALAGTSDSGRVLLDIQTGERQAARIVAFVDKPSLQVPTDELTGHFTVLAQVDELQLEEGEELMVFRIVRGAPAGAVEREAMTEGTQGIIEASEGMGVTLGKEDVSMPSPLVVLRPICIWR